MIPEAQRGIDTRGASDLDILGMIALFCHHFGDFHPVEVSRGPMEPDLSKLPPIWERIARAVPTKDGTPSRGKVLAVKLGYNPNSSSIGTATSVLLWGMLAGYTLFNLLSAIVLSRAAAEENGGAK